MARIPTQLTLADMEDTDEYRAFEEKFKPKKTTDECHTPPEVYEAVASWVEGEFGVDRARFVRPFWPGGDFERHDYPEGCVVVDNPPFSILAHIVRTYVAAGVDFFLFAPALTCFTAGAGACCHLTTDCDITYANGASVRTAFLTSLDRENEIRTAPDLTKAVNDAMARVLAEGKTELPKYVYPYEVLTAARGSWLSKWGADLRVRHGDCVRVGTLDAQRAYGKSIFGGGLHPGREGGSREGGSREGGSREGGSREGGSREGGSPTLAALRKGAPYPVDAGRCA